MPKERTRPELYICFHIGLQPKDLIEKGIKASTVYSYSSKYKKKVKPEFDKLMKGG